MDRKIEKLSTNDEVFFGVRNEDFDIWYDTHGFKQFVITQCIPNTFEEVFLGYINYFLLLFYSIWNFTLHQLFPLVIFIQYEISLTCLFLTNMVYNPVHKRKKKKDILINNPRPTTMIHQMTKTNNYRIMKIPWILAKAE